MNNRLAFFYSGMLLVWIIYLAITPVASQAAPSVKIRIVLVGDSTVNDAGGWGYGFKQYVTDAVECTNLAANGRSSKSFLTEGRWEKALALKGDYYFIQFGHNDEPGKGPERETDPATTYTQNLARYVDEARAIGAKPVLVTSLTRRNFDKSNPEKLSPSLVPYVAAMKKLAEEKKVPLVDLHALSVAYCEKIGSAETAKFNPVGKDGRPDMTHLNAQGRLVFAKLVVEGVRQVVPELAPYLRTEPMGAESAGPDESAKPIISAKDSGTPLSITPALPQIADRTFNVIQFGAVGDGVTTNTSAIQSAIDAASAVGGGIVEVPSGVFLSGPLRFANGINLRVNGTLQMLPLDKYPGGMIAPENFISGSDLHDIAISGAGTIDGQGIPWWPYAKSKSAKRPRMIAFSSCQRVLIEGVRLTNSPMFHIAISGKTTDVTVRGVAIHANSSTDPVNPSHNTDACDVTGKRILIQDCDVSVGDDNYTCGGGTSDVLITNCTYGNGHGLSIGSYTSPGVSNFTVVNCTFNNTEAGIRIKTDRDRGGFVRNLTYLNLRMTNVGFPILIYTSYMATNREYRALKNVTPAIAATYPRAAITGKTPIYRDITFSNITATVTSGSRAGLIWGLPEMAITNVLLERVNITADKPLGIFEAQNVRLVNCNIITPGGVNQLATTNAQVTVISH